MAENSNSDMAQRFGAEKVSHLKVLTRNGYFEPKLKRCLQQSGYLGQVFFEIFLGSFASKIFYQ